MRSNNNDWVHAEELVMNDKMIKSCPNKPPKQHFA